MLRRVVNRLTAYALATASVVLLASANTAAAQTTTGTIRGYVRSSDGQPVADATIAVRNIGTSATRGAQSNANGFYAIPGIVPGEYEITVRKLGTEPQTRRQRVQIGEVLTLDLTVNPATTQLAAVTVVAASTRETRTTEVATNVSAEQISSLPTVDRNFLGLAALAPSVRVSGQRREGNTKSFSAGALPAQNINVFIDGASYKSDVLSSGVTGQESSRGNPFPQIAVQEFRVLTQNFKAEYQKASSAIITATTKSGTNEWHGTALYAGQTKGFQALDEFQRRDRRVAEADDRTFEKADYSRNQTALSLGGPIIRDKMFFFGAYEGNFQNRANRVDFGDQAAQFPAVFGGREGNFTSPFRSSLGIAKLNFAQNETQNWELSYNLRTETDIRSFGGQTSFESAENVKVDVNTLVLKHTYGKGSRLNETLVSYQDSKWNPVPENDDLVGLDYAGIGRVGGRDTYQKFDQKRLSLRNDFTYSGFNAHVIKVGGNFDFNKYEVLKEQAGNPIFKFRSTENFAFPFEAEYGSGDPNMNTNNNQVGLYAQDDWSITPRLTVNLGLRWDYETDMFNNDYVTPPLVRQELGSQFPSVFFTDGDDRPGFKRAFQPRVGFNYAVDAAGRTSVFGAFGVYYDRSNYNNGLDEKFRLQYRKLNIRFSADGAPRDGFPTTRWDPRYLSRSGLDQLIATGTAGRPEVFLIDNNTKPPRSNQFSFGLRHNTGNVVLSATQSIVNSYNGFTYTFGTRNPDGSCCRQVSPEFSNVLLSNNDPRTWYNATILQADKPYRRVGNGFNWGGGLSYTLADAEQQGGDLFSLDAVSVKAYPRTGTDQNQRHTVIGNFIVDIPYFFGTQFSGILNLGSGDKFFVTDCTAGYGPGQCRLQRGSGEIDDEWKGSFIAGKWAFRNVDLRLRKDFPPIGTTRIGLIADLFNAFNFVNYGDYDGFIRSATDPAGPNPAFGIPRRVNTDGRRFQLGAQVDW